MSKTSKRSKRPRKTVDRSVTTDVMTQLECAIRNPQAALIGALFGGLVPWFGRTLAHDQVPTAWAAGNTLLVAALLAVVLGCALFSALSVYKFGKAAFGDERKALGFVLALEGVMLVSTGTTSAVSLAALILINAVANGSVIALARDATCKRREADARRAATVRARSQTAAARRSPIAVIDAEDVPAPSKRTARASRPAVSVTPKWMDDVVDAEIVSEQKLLS
jgi:hypothetical protein